MPGAVEVAGLAPDRRIHILELPPAGQDVGGRLDVHFRVIGVVAGARQRSLPDREELLQFTAVIFIGARLHVVRPVEINEHRAVLRDRVCHVFEIAEHVVAEEHVILVGVTRVVHRRHLRDEVIGPEERQFFPYGETLVQNQSEPPGFEGVDPDSCGVKRRVRVKRVDPRCPDGNELARVRGKRLRRFIRLGGQEKVDGVAGAERSLERVHVGLGGPERRAPQEVIHLNDRPGARVGLEAGGGSGDYGSGSVCEGADACVLLLSFLNPVFFPGAKYSGRKSRKRVTSSHCPPPFFLFVSDQTCIQSHELIDICQGFVKIF